MGILLLPSLEEKRHIRLEEISQTEAELFIKNLEDRVKASRTLNVPKDSTTDAFLTYRLRDDLDVFDLETLSAELSESEVPKHRGIRAVFFNEDDGTVIVGTSVVYGATYAMVGFDDSTIAQTILDF